MTVRIIPSLKRSNGSCGESSRNNPVLWRRLLPATVCLTVIILQLSVFNLFSQTRQQIKNRKIKSVLIRWEDFRKDSVSKKSERTKYDHKGNPIEIIEYDERGNIVKWEKASYDKHGNRTSSEQLNPFGKTIKKIITNYNRKGNETYYERMDSSGNTVKKVVTSYDKWGNVGERLETGSNGEITAWEKLKYNSYDDKISEISLDKNGNEIRKALYDYDGKGMLKSKKIYDEKGALIYSRDYTYEY